MMNIQSAIREYILSHDFVMLPGIGAFVAEYSKPYFDQNGEIVPAERTIRFNPLLRNDSDVDILNVFKEKMRISDTEVQEQYFAFLDTVNAQITAFNRYYWEDFGILLREGPDAPFQFLPFTPSTSGEPVVQRKPVQEEPSPETVLPEPEITAPPVKTYREKDPVEEEEVPESGKAARYLIFALPLALLTAALIYMVFFKPSLRESVKEKAAPVFNDSDFEEGAVTVDTLYSEPAPQTVVAEEHIVRIGIYKREKDAEKIVAFLSGKGYAPRVRPHGPLFKVYLVADTEEQARRYIKEVEQLIDDTPIYERKKNNG